MNGIVGLFVFGTTVHLFRCIHVNERVKGVQTVEFQSHGAKWHKAWLPKRWYPMHPAAVEAERASLFVSAKVIRRYLCYIPQWPDPTCLVHGYSS